MPKEIGKVRISINPRSNPEPFNDGKYLHYTRFHPQLQDMIGTEGYFYDCIATDVNDRALKRLKSVTKNGYPHSDNGWWSYFAVPIDQPKTEITLQEIADKFGVSVEQLRIKE